MQVTDDDATAGNVTTFPGTKPAQEQQRRREHSKAKTKDPTPGQAISRGQKAERGP
jgi:hypothetical protein